MVNDIEARKETGFKVQKLPTELYKQRQYEEMLQERFYQDFKHDNMKDYENKFYQ